MFATDNSYRHSYVAVIPGLRSRTRNPERRRRKSEPNVRRKRLAISLELTASVDQTRRSGFRISAALVRNDDTLRNECALLQTRTKGAQN